MSIERHDPNSDFPNTFIRLENDERISRPRVFEPALKQFARAFRLGEPEFSDAAVESRWYQTRTRVMHHLLRVVAESRWHDNLVLRGSLLLKAWLGDAAREPGDMDFVVWPRSLRLGDAWSHEFFTDFIQFVVNYPTPRGVEWVAEDVAIDDIWIYDRAPGRRIVFPYRASDLPSGAIQADFVFGEELWWDPIHTNISDADGKALSVWSARRDVSLAWKIQWLETDLYPQGKDLYDATLLAETTELPLDLLRNVLERSGWAQGRPLTQRFPLCWDVDWDTFKREYPWVIGEARDWQERLSLALTRTFSPKM